MPKIRNVGKHGRPTYNQAAKIIARFGSESKLAAIVGCARISCYRWQYRRPYGSDGLIPSAMVEKIHRVARINGILLTDHDWTPERVVYEDEYEPPLDEILYGAPTA